MSVVAGLAGTATAAAAAYSFSGWDWPDWDIARHAGRLVLQGELQVYALMPRAQMGPLALAVAGLLPHPAYVVLVCALFPVFIALVHRLALGRFTVWHVLGAVLVGYPWHRFAITGHLDDSLVVISALGMADAFRRRSVHLMVVWLLLGVAGKPTAVMFVPLVFLVSFRGGLIALVGVGLVYLPFLVADPPGFLHAGRGVVPVLPHSVPALLGSPVSGAFPAWLRPVQLAGSASLCWFLGRRGAPVAGVVAAFTFRTIPEPGMFAAYCTSVLAACLALDVMRRDVPWMTGLAMVAWLASNFAAVSVSALPAVVRLLALLGILVSAAIFTDAPARPASGPSRFRWLRQSPGSPSRARKPFDSVR